MMTRYLDWQSRMAAVVQARLHVPFAWGTNDCAMFAADVVQAITGTDLAAEYRGYSTEGGAAKILKRSGGLEGLATKALGEPCAALTARPGDVGLVVNAGRDCLGVCTGATWHVPGEHGLLALPLSDAVKSWRVG